VKKIIMALLFIFCIASTANAANFVEIYRDNNYLVYLDLDSFQNKGDYATCWTKLIPMGKELERQNKAFNKNVSHFINFGAYKLNEHQLQFLSGYVYFENGADLVLLHSDFSIYNWQEIVPESIGEYIWKSINIIAERL